jgi:hypothetical protein
MNIRQFLFLLGSYTYGTNAHALGIGHLELKGKARGRGNSRGVVPGGGTRMQVRREEPCAVVRNTEPWNPPKKKGTRPSFWVCPGPARPCRWHPYQCGKSWSTMRSWGSDAGQNRSRVWMGWNGMWVSRCRTERRVLSSPSRLACRRC